jgi:hypothetical protein
MCAIWPPTPQTLEAAKDGLVFDAVLAKKGAMWKVRT